MSRKTARRYAFELIFQMPFHKDFDAEYALESYPEDNLPEISEAERAFVKETLYGVRAHLGLIDKLIAENTEGWSVNRLNSVDLAVLRLAVYEMAFTDTPERVSINEAVELSKMYSGEESGGFVNGILAKASAHAEAHHA
ncbi:MAG: transcription antitermination factor NusB [Clostridiales bacterium]|jgi:N utilization substance protein B|nr:transcription antitermination factor NusB [Clostridiales bacterium]